VVYKTVLDTYLDGQELERGGRVPALFMRDVLDQVEPPSR